jgi:hypothetical protein
MTSRRLARRVFLAPGDPERNTHALTPALQRAARTLSSRIFCTMNVATVLDSSLPISIVRRHSGMISVDSRNAMTSVSSTCAFAHLRVSSLSKLLAASTPAGQIGLSNDGAGPALPAPRTEWQVCGTCVPGRPASRQGQRRQSRAGLPRSLRRQPSWHCWILEARGAARPHLDQRANHTQAGEAQVLKRPRLADCIQERVQEHRYVRCVHRHARRQRPPLAMPPQRRRLLLRQARLQGSWDRE